MTTELSLYTFMSLELPFHSKIAKYLTVKDLCNLASVSKGCKAIYESDQCWKRIAKEYNVDKNEVVRSSYILRIKNYLYYLPSIIAKALTTPPAILKTGVRNKVKEILETTPKELIKLFPNIQSIAQLKIIKISINEIVEKVFLRSGAEDIEYSHFQDSYYNAPITRVLAKSEDNKIVTYFLFRFRDNETNECYKESIGVDEFNSSQYFNSFDNNKTNLLMGSAVITRMKTERLKRLIVGEPVGVLLEVDRAEFSWLKSPWTEGPLKTSDGTKSTLELY